MGAERTDTLVIGAGQAGVAMSAHLARHGLPHVVLERNRTGGRWTTERWDSLVANGPAWHDRFPAMEFSELDPAIGPDGFARANQVAAYLETFARRHAAPIRCGVEVTAVRRRPDGAGFRAETTAGPIEARNVVAATGPFQRPVIPALVPASYPVHQLHSASYRNPTQLPPGGVLVIGAGSSGAQIADELLRAGRTVHLSIGLHNRPPRRYRGRDYCWWLGVLGKWDVKPPRPGTEHVTIAVSGAGGGHTVDFRRFAGRGMVLHGRAEAFCDGVVRFAPDLAHNIARGDADYLSVLDEADAYAARHGLDLPPEPEARQFDPDPACLAEPILELDLVRAGIGTILWATGYTFDFGWLEAGAFDDAGRPVHQGGISPVPGLYFIGLPWLTNRSSSFIWGAWRDAETLAGHIAARMAPSEASAA